MQNFDLDSLSRLQEALENVYGISLTSQLIAIITVLMFKLKIYLILWIEMKPLSYPFYYKIPKNYQYLLSKDEME